MASTTSIFSKEHFPRNLAILGGLVVAAAFTFDIVQPNTIHLFSRCGGFFLAAVSINYSFVNGLEALSASGPTSSPSVRTAAWRNEAVAVWSIAGAAVVAFGDLVAHVLQ